MRKFMRQIMSIFMILALLVPYMPTSFAEATDLCSYEVLFDNDFETGEKGFNIKGQAGFGSYDSKYGKSLKIPMRTGGASVSFSKQFDNPVTEGLLYVAYDNLKTAQGGRSYDLLYDRPVNEAGWLSGTYLASIYWSGTYFSYADNLDVKSTYDQNLPYIDAPPAEKWLHIDYWFDLDNRMVYAYKDGEEYFVTRMTDKMSQISAIGYTGNPLGLDTDIYFDNYKAIHFKNGFDESIVPEAQAIPGYVKSALHTEIETGKLGHNFFTKDIEFDVTINNTLNVSQKAEIKVNVINDNGNSVYEKAEKVNFEADKKTLLHHSFTAEEYGFYDVFIDVIPEDSEKAFKIDVRNRISCLKKSEKMNPKMGVADHYRSQQQGIQEVDRKMKLLKDSGMSFSREEVHQQWARRSPGKYERDEMQKYWEGVAQDNGLHQVVLLEGENLPTIDNPEKSADFENYVYSTVKELKGRSVFFEVGNEPNYKAGFNSNELVKTNYVHALKIAYKAAKRANPDCEIMALCVCEYDMDYIEAFLSAGVSEYMDGMSLHPYMLTQSPENGGMYEKLQQVKDLMEKYGCGDKKLYITEIGWTAAPGFTSEERKTAYQLRTLILIGHELELFTWYNCQYKDYVVNERERHFGLIFNDGYAGDRVSYGAHPALLTVSHWNSLMIDSQFEKRVDSGSDDIRLYKYKLADGKDVLIAYTTDEEQNRSVGLDLGTNSIELRDMYGNPKTIYAKDGIVSLSLSFEPVYIIGNFSKMEVTKSKVELPTSIVNMITGEDTVVSIEGENCDGLTVEVGVPDGFKITENNGFKNGEAKILFQSSAERVDRGKVNIDIKDGDRLLFTHKCSIEYTDPISYTYKISPYNSQKTWVEADFTNHRITPVKLELDLESPDGLLRNKYVIDRIDPKVTRRLRINVPIQYMNHNKINFNGTIKSTSGTSVDYQPFTATVTPGFVYYTDKIPKIDGYISDDEWIKDLGMVFDARNGAKEMVVKEKSDFYGKGYLMCNDEYLYFAVEIEDDVLGDMHPASTIWDNDSVQFAFAQKAVYGYGRTEINMGISNGEKVLSRSSYMGTGKTTEQMNVFEDTEFAVRRDEKARKTYYEIKLPWRECFDTEFDPKARETMAFSVCINENDGIGVNNTSNVKGRAYYEYIGGIGSSKDSGLFVAFPILKVNK